MGGNVETMLEKLVVVKLVVVAWITPRCLAKLLGDEALQSMGSIISSSFTWW